MKFNVNIGVLGHVDCGKTTLCKNLSTIGSTAAFDSNPQSKERGITLDLGFSSFTLPKSTTTTTTGQGDEWNFTLVDCPGHASLIRTVIGGSQIMDCMILVIDINKGMQPQTAECLILAQITSNHLIVVLNKIDVIPEGERKKKIEKIKKLMTSTLSKTKFCNEPIVSVSALDSSIGVEELKSALLQKVDCMELKRFKNQPFLMAIDHCFSIKGQGTILTGTILQGALKINDTVEIPSLIETRKVKSIQSFRISVQEASGGDRVGICLPGLDPTNIERTYICAPGLLRISCRAAICSFERIPYFKKPIQSKKKYHISIGYDTIAARLTLFQSNSTSENCDFNPSIEYLYIDQNEVEKDDKKPTTATTITGTDEKTETEIKREESKNSKILGLLEFDRPSMIIPQALIIGSDLQTINESVCRIAFHGKIIDSTEDKNYLINYLPKIKMYKTKSKQGALDRIVSVNALIAKGFCKKESNIDHLIGLIVHIVDSKGTCLHKGRIESRFGQTNKVRVGLSEPMSDNEEKFLKDNLKNCTVQLNFKKYIFSSTGENKLIQ